MRVTLRNMLLSLVKEFCVRHEGRQPKTIILPPALYAALLQHYVAGHSRVAAPDGYMGLEIRLHESDEIILE